MINFNFKTKFDMENNTSTNHENGNDANVAACLMSVFNEFEKLNYESD